ncbi:MAG: Ribosome production factor 1 [Ramalina farinacea]|uniref:Ribosome production factor 1 n=1 Tax=Ramalina farinacea TaxID=258253 RepID=A0AA43QUT5_9LECA|nr:Ribosome production factor 1 [Ramalina farinacea]
MASKKLRLGPKASLPFKASNKEKRQNLHIKRKKAVDSTKRDERFRRRRDEDKDPKLREERLRHNVPLTLERKRVWDDVDRDTGDGLGVSVDVERMKKQKLEDDGQDRAESDDDSELLDGSDTDRDSMIDPASDSESDSNEGAKVEKPKQQSTKRTPTERATSPIHSTTSTNLDLTPEALALKFPTLFSQDPPPTPKILVTTSLNSTLHHEAELLTTLFPFSVYIPRSSHRYSHKFSLREISAFAANRNYTTVLVLEEDQKKPKGLTMVHLPAGPTFHFTVSSWVDGKRIPGHGRPTEHIPELILNNFRTPLGLLTAHLFRTLFPPQPELRGRQVVTLHNQRDYIFLRRHRYVFREKRASEKNVVGPDGKEVPGVEGLRAGLQELGPRFTLKLRRVDKGIQRSSGQEWEWKGGMEKVRTKFQL